jgi:hypothetical protein
MQISDLEIAAYVVLYQITQQVLVTCFFPITESNLIAKL